MGCRLDHFQCLLFVMRSTASLDAVHAHAAYGWHAVVECERRFLGTERNKPLLACSQWPLVMAENSLDVAKVAKGHQKLLVRRCRDDADPEPSASPSNSERGCGERLWCILREHTMGTGVFAYCQKSHHVLQCWSATGTSPITMNLQDVVVTDPFLMAQILHDKDLYKPAEPDYIKFRKVSTHAGTSCKHRHLLLRDFPADPHALLAAVDGAIWSCRSGYCRE